MADTKISGLTATTSISGDDLLVVVDDPGGTPATKKITVTNFAGTLPTARVGDGTNYTDIASDGTLTLAGTATTFEDLVVPLNAGRQGATSKPDYSYTTLTYEFPKNDATEILYFVVQMPHRWKAGSSIYPHVHWLKNAANAVGWKIDYKWTNIGAAPAANFTTLALDTESAEYTTGVIHQINKSAAISGSGKTMSSIIQVKLYRDDNVYTGDASALQFDIHYEVDSFGSSAEYTK